MKISILTMCPELFRYCDDSAIISRAIKNGSLELEIIDFRDYTEGSFRKIDDSPYGGGRGMVIRCQPVVDALEDIRTDKSNVVLLSPKGQKYDQKKARAYAATDHLILICGHYEGFDARIFPYADEIVSIGDYILSGGELAAQVITDSVSRLLEGSLKEGSADEESFENGLLEYPQYTRPADFRGDKVPEILLSGDHEAIRAWRKEQAMEWTRKTRPDLIEETGDGSVSPPARNQNKAYKNREEETQNRPLSPERREELESLYAKGMLSSDELLRKKTILYRDLTMMLSKNDLEDQLPSEEMLALCGLRKEDISGKTETVELEHDPLDDGRVYVFKGLTGLEHLLTEKNPEGKQFTFRLPLTHAGKTIWKDYQFEVISKKAGEDNWQGWTEYKGVGRFSIYAGEGTLLVRQESEKISSALYQKYYRETDGRF